MRHRDRDLLILEKPVGAELRDAREPRARGDESGPWPLSALERDASGLALLARTEEARRALSREVQIQIRYVAVIEHTGGAKGKTGRVPDVLVHGARRSLVSFDEQDSRGLSSSVLARRGYTVARAEGRDGRLWLHAARIALQHPSTGRALELESAVPGEFWREVGANPPPVASPSAAQVGSADTGRSTAGSTDWGDVALWFDTLLEDREHDHYRDVILPRTLQLLELVPGCRVLDVACGQGVLCRALAQRGFETVGVDASPELVELGRRRNVGYRPEPQLRVGDVRALADSNLGEFDRAACVMALTNIDPIDPVLVGCADSLSASGIFVAVIPHPAFRVPRHSRWHWEKDESGVVRQSRQVDSYLRESRAAIVANPGAVARGEPAVQTWSFHRPLQRYVAALASARLYVDRIEEWISERASDSGPRAAEENRARQEIPLFLALRARKAGSR